MLDFFDAMLDKTCAHQTGKNVALYCVLHRRKCLMPAGLDRPAGKRA